MKLSQEAEELGIDIAQTAWPLLHVDSNYTVSYNGKEIAYCNNRNEACNFTMGFVSALNMILDKEINLDSLSSS